MEPCKKEYPELDVDLDTIVIGYNKKNYSLAKLRETANKYKWNDPNIAVTKKKHEKIYNCLLDIVPFELISQVYSDIPENFTEHWEKVPDWFYDYYKIKNLSYEVSNLGRIRIKIDEKYLFLLQDDKIGHHGYLVISKDNEKKYSSVRNHSVEIYKFISAAFLGKPEDKRIHHIDNNGYDCRPENLILLTKTEHSKAHGFPCN